MSFNSSFELQVIANSPIDSYLLCVPVCNLSVSAIRACYSCGVAIPWLFGFRIEAEKLIIVLIYSCCFRFLIESLKVRLIVLIFIDMLPLTDSIHGVIVIDVSCYAEEVTFSAILQLFFVFRSKLSFLDF